MTSTALAAIQSIDDIPIPADVRPGPGWTAQMVEMADHIGPYLTLLIVERFGGQQLYISADPAKNIFRELVGEEAAAILSHVYQRELLQIPTAKFALRHVRRASVIATVRAGMMTTGEAANIIGTSRTYVSHLVNSSDEGWKAPVLRVRRRHDPRQIDMFGQDND